MTTFTTTCPDWCTKDHDTYVEWAREKNARIKFGTPEQAQSDLEDALAYERDYHYSHDFMAEVLDEFDVRITTELDGPLRVCVEIPQSGLVSAGEARICGQALLAAADKLDEIQAATASA